MPLTAYGDKETPITLEMKNVEISLRKGFENIDFMHVANHKKIALTNVTIDNYQGKHLIKAWTDGVVEAENLNCDIEEKNYVVMAEEVFTCQPI